MWGLLWWGGRFESGGMVPKGRLQVIALVLRVCLGAWFVDSGVRKVFVTGLDRFTVDVGNYQLVGAPWDGVIAYTLPWLEVVAGLCLVLGFLRRGAILTVAGMVVMFAAGVGWAWWQGLDISCGCRGGDEPMNYWVKMGEFLLYSVVLGFLWIVELKAEAKRRWEAEIAGITE